MKFSVSFQKAKLIQILYSPQRTQRTQRYVIMFCSFSPYPIAFCFFKYIFLCDLSEHRIEIILGNWK